MLKYGRGLSREIVGSASKVMITEPLGIPEIINFTLSKGWKIPDKYINVTLANAVNLNHSLTYKKYFSSFGDG